MNDGLIKSSDDPIDEVTMDEILDQSNTGTSDIG